MTGNTYDVVVVGAGNAALCAAISAHESGAKVLVLEKGPKEKRGGNSFFTDGAIRFAYNGLESIKEIVNISEEEAQKIEMPNYSEEDYYNDLMRVTGNRSEPGLARQLVSKSFETIAWMKANDITFELIYDNQSFEKDGKRHFWGGLPVKTADKGVGLIKQLNERAAKLGIEVWYEAAATGLQKEAGCITGITVNRQGEELPVDTQAVVLACGGFEANKKMRMEHLGEEWEAAIVRGTEFNTGDGLSMAVAARRSASGPAATRSARTTTRRKSAISRNRATSSKSIRIL
ncbi:hypothetical protein G159_19365 [Planococcus glaciei CHR43]|nr:hypothetical protein G159_19365 [Planococcus glaciei CHR43]